MGILFTNASSVGGAHFQVWLLFLLFCMRIIPNSLLLLVLIILKLVFCSWFFIHKCSWNVPKRRKHGRLIVARFITKVWSIISIELQTSSVSQVQEIMKKISNVKAQIASKQRGMNLLKRSCSMNTVVLLYMINVKKTAALAVEDHLKDLAKKNRRIT